MAEAAEVNFEVEEEEVLEILEEEFQHYFIIASLLMRELKSQMDRKICKKYLDKCLALQKSDDISVKFNRNQFLMHFLEVISESRTFEMENKVIENNDSVNIPASRYFQQWSEDGKAFLAIKEIPNTGILIYTANSSEENTSWEKFDLSTVNLTELNSKISFTN